MHLDGDREAASVIDDFAQKMRTLRLHSRLTQEGLAQRAGLSARTVRDIERGKVNFPRTHTVRLIGTALGLQDSRLTQFIEQARTEYWRERQMSS